MGLPGFLKIDELQDEKFGFLKDGWITITARISIQDQQPEYLLKKNLRHQSSDSVDHRLLKDARQYDVSAIDKSDWFPLSKCLSSLLQDVAPVLHE